MAFAMIAMSKSGLEERVRTETRSRLHTPLCDVLGIEYPIVEAPIAAEPALVAAVSNAGGLGMLPMSWSDPDEAREIIQATRKLTKKPFGVNLAVQWSPSNNLKACLDEGVEIISFFWGDPSRYIKTVHDAGGKVLSTVGSASEAARFADAGADVIVAQGLEAGGHVWGKVASLPLVPLVVDATKPKPVVSAGGIGDGRGIAAVFMLGAAGVWMGTRFIATEESPFHEKYKERILMANETETEYTTLFNLGWKDAPHRTLRNDTISNWVKAGTADSGKRPGEGDLVATFQGGGGVPRYATTPPYSGMEGKVEDMAMYAGQSCGLISSIQPASEIVRQFVDEALKAMKAGTDLATG